MMVKEAVNEALNSIKIGANFGATITKRIQSFDWSTRHFKFVSLKGYCLDYLTSNSNDVISTRILKGYWRYLLIRGLIES